MNEELRHRAGALLGSDPEVAWWVPGRIEFLGKHTDYAGGRSLLCAVDRGIYLAARGRDDDRLLIRDAVRGDAADSRLDPGAPPREAHWGLYADVVGRRLARDLGPGLRGADIVIASDLPMAAGISSSSALVSGLALTIAALNQLDERELWQETMVDHDALASYLSCVENGLPFGTMPGDSGVGVMNGSEDHTAILQSRPGALIQYSFAPIRFEGVVPLPADHVFAVASSGVVAEKSGSARRAYNSLAELAAEVADMWRSATGGTESNLGAIVSSSVGAADRLRALLSAEHLERVDQFILESESLVPASAAALRRGDLNALGAIVDRSLEAADRWLRNQVAETLHLAKSARTLGATAASAFGAGFGGSVWALVRKRNADQFLTTWRDDYALTFPDRSDATFFLTNAGSPATRVT